MGGPAAVALAVGGSHACLRDRSDGVWCWGAATNDQLLDRDYLDEVAEPSRIEGIRDAVALAGTPTRVCALLADRRVACWGAANAPGEPPTWSSVPRSIGGLTDAVAVFTTGEQELCARRSNHRVACWGATAGLRHARDAQPEPQDPWTAASCQVDLRGQVWCDGANHRGQRGCSHRDDSPPAPTAVCDLGEPAVEVARGRSHACALHPSGHVSCWGDNRWFQLGQATAPMPASSELPEDPWYAPTALRVPEIEDATQILAAGDYTCALHRSGEVSCWGANSTGQCGQGSGEPQPEPVRVELPPRGLHASR
ncbi:hypothetical protein OV090_15185 [Nannocystis sp. RBIL2]|uniref:RCC1 domain-containing protein n=1 Tax=Nannocystis sp. RBIL2 TaxID=2996788 RepID=UPI0022711C5C|nr:hypothetical protein [Nannocystis sp. RBIL2]